MDYINCKKYEKINKEIAAKRFYDSMQLILSVSKRYADDCKLLFYDSRNVLNGIIDETLTVLYHYAKMFSGMSSFIWYCII